VRKHLVEDPQFPHLGGNILEGDDATWEPRMWGWLLERFQVRTVLDLGCGSGFSTRWFREEAGVEAIGLDGLLANVERCGEPSILCDLTKPLPELPDVDLVWCCEVVGADPQWIRRQVHAKNGVLGTGAAVKRMSVRYGKPMLSEAA